MFVISKNSLYRSGLCSLYRRIRYRFIISRLCSIHFTVTLAGIWISFVISRNSLNRGSLNRGSTVLLLRIRSTEKAELSKYFWYLVSALIWPKT